MLRELARDCEEIAQGWAGRRLAPHFSPSNPCVAPQNEAEESDATEDEATGRRENDER